MRRELGVDVEEITPGDLSPCLFWLALPCMETQPGLMLVCSSHWSMEAHPRFADAVPNYHSYLTTLMRFSDNVQNL